MINYLLCKAATIKRRDTENNSTNIYAIADGDWLVKTCHFLRMITNIVIHTSINKRLILFLSDKVANFIAT
jgi:hypothetical protein